MVRKVNHDQLGQLVKLFYSCPDKTGRKIPMLITGTFGIGKSMVIKVVGRTVAVERTRTYLEWNEISYEEKIDIINNNKLKDYFIVMDMRLSEFDATDIKGLPDFDKLRKWVEWKYPFFVEVLQHPDSDGILFFDEFNLACLTGETNILTKQGYKFIKDIKIGDRVLDVDGKYSKVTSLSDDKYNGYIYDIKATGCLNIEATPNHPFLVIEDYRKPNKQWNIKGGVSKPIWKLAMDIKEGDYVCSLNQTETDKEIIFTPENAKFLGMYMANGWVEKNKNSTYFRVGLSYGTSKKKERKEVEEILEHIKDDDKKIGMYIRNNAVTYRIGINEHLYAELKAFGKAKDKYIPDTILDNPNKDVLISFLDGYLKGDGCFIKNNKTSYIQFATSSKKLALGLQRIFARLGVLACIKEDKKIRTNYIDGRKITWKGGYNISVNDKKIQEIFGLKHTERKRETEHFFLHNNKLWFKVRDIKKKRKKTMVYNFGVESGKTYTANNIVTHNTPLVISSCYKIFHDKIINDTKINFNWLIIGCGNKDDDRANTHEIAAPLKDRCAEMELTPPTPKDWIKWASRYGLNPKIIAYISWKGTMLRKVNFESGEKFTTERGWERLNCFMHRNLEEIKLVSGTVIGEGVASEFMGFLEIQNIINLDDILKKPELLKNVTEAGQKYFVISGLAERYGDNHMTIEQLFEVSTVLQQNKSADFVAMLWRLASRMNKAKFRKEFTTKELGHPLRAVFLKYLTDD